MSETRSRMSSGPSRFMGGALIAANRTAPSLVTLSFSKTRESSWLLSSIGLDICLFSLSGRFCRRGECCRILPDYFAHAQWLLSRQGEHVACQPVVTSGTVQIGHRREMVDQISRETSLDQPVSPGPDRNVVIIDCASKRF